MNVDKKMTFESKPFYIIEFLPWSTYLHSRMTDFAIAATSADACACLMRKSCAFSNLRVALVIQIDAHGAWSSGQEMTSFPRKISFQLQRSKLERPLWCMDANHSRRHKQNSVRQRQRCCGVCVASSRRADLGEEARGSCCCYWGCCYCCCC